MDSQTPAGQLRGEGAARTLPFGRLPSSFLLSLNHPPAVPAFPEPSATLALIRERSRGLQVLLLKRTPRSGFIPGTWVFPGGRVDPEDGHPELLDRVRGAGRSETLDRLDLDEDEPPALAYWVAAIRETFEETGILPASNLDPTHAPFIREARERLLAGKSSFQDLLEEADLRLDASALTYIGHWITPECEPRRYQTRFFLAATEGDIPVLPHEDEMVDHQWFVPADALALNRTGSLPLVLPTLATLEDLASFSTIAEAVSRLGALPVPRLLPVPNRAEGGFRFVLPG